MEHLTISRQWRSSLSDVRNRRIANVGSDYHLVLGEITLKIAAINRLNQSKRGRFDTRKLNNAKIAESFKSELRNRFQVSEEDDLEGELVADINRQYNKITDRLN
jgi:hypothetical protein